MVVRLSFGKVKCNLFWISNSLLTYLISVKPKCPSLWTGQLALKAGPFWKKRSWLGFKSTTKMAELFLNLLPSCPNLNLLYILPLCSRTSTILVSPENTLQASQLQPHLIHFSDCIAILAAAARSWKWWTASSILRSLAAMVVRLPIPLAAFPQVHLLTVCPRCADPLTSSTLATTLHICWTKTTMEFSRSGQLNTLIRDRVAGLSLDRTSKFC